MTGEPYAMDIRLLVATIQLWCTLAFLFIRISLSSILPPHLACAIQRTSFSRNSTSLSVIHSIRVRDAYKVGALLSSRVRAF
jgi:hypothetical protein